MARVALRVNGQRREVEIDGEIPLLWVLRDQLRLLGAKYGCGVGVCGSCTVHVDGEATRSCITATADVRGSEIVTIEGLAGDALHPVQQAWLDEEVAQCGFCQAGQIMAAVALLERTPHPTDAQIDEAMREIICRCGTYERIRRAIHLAAAGGGR
jgi:isoquinoline 1-oxidoreductase subunit alpha